MAANWTPFVSGAVLTAAQLNDVVDNFADMAIFNESQASGTAGGTFTSGSFIKRTLNTTVVNNITGCSISSSVITLPAGTFFVNAFSPANNVNKQKTKLRNTTDSTDTLIGTNCYANADVSCPSNIVGVFTIAASKTFELQARCGITQVTYGLGEPCSYGISEVYSVIQIVRIA
jgi:hypothetical protein